MGNSPHEKGKANLTILLYIDRWKEIAAREVDNIGAWRGASKAKLARYRWDDCSAFFVCTQLVSDWIVENFPKLESAPLRQVYEAVSCWHKGRGSVGVPDQATLYSQLEHAMLVVNTVQSQALQRIGRSDSTPRTGTSQDDVLRYLLEHKVFTKDTRTTATVVAKDTGNDNKNNLKRPISALQRLGYVDTCDGNRGGVWLTPEGRQFAESRRNDETVRSKM